MTIGERQRDFTLMVAGLVTWAYAQGYELTYGEALRSDEQAEINAMGPTGRSHLAAIVEKDFPILAYKIRNNVGSGIRDSLHVDRLAVDFMLFINGIYQTSTEAYRPLGEKWEAMGGAWGGRFGDADHFSLAFGGRK